MGKPFNIDELLLRIHAILRRVKRNKNNETQPETTSASSPISVNGSKPGHLITIGEYSLNTRTYEFHSALLGTIRLTPVQYDLLYHLMTHPGEIFSPNRLLDEVWDYPSDTGSPDLVRVHVKNLRERIENDPRAPLFIKTIPGFGYTIQLD